MILLDTHAWLWWVADAPELPPRLKATINGGSEPIAVASMSCLEVAWLAKKGRIVLPVGVEQFFDRAIDQAGFQLLPLTPKIAARSASLPDLHRDPVDRVLIATAIEFDATLATKDGIIRQYPDVRVLWGAWASARRPCSPPPTWPRNTGRASCAPRPAGVKQGPAQACPVVRVGRGLECP